MSEPNKRITLTSSWKNCFWGYFWGVLLAPVLVGIIILWFTNKSRKSIQYQITDLSVARIEGNEKKELELVHILETSFSQTGLQKFFGIGNIHFKANVSELIFEGLEHVESLLDKIDTAIAYQKEQLKASKKIKGRKATHDPGTLDKLEYLTGLWQQGLISEDDYDNERKKFE